MSKTKLNAPNTTEAQILEEVRRQRKKEKVELLFQRTFQTHTKCVKMNGPLAEKALRGRPRRPHIWPNFPSAWYCELTLTPEQLSHSCWAIREAIAQGKQGHWEISLIDKTQSNTFSTPLPLKSVLIDAKFLGRTNQCGFYLREDERVDATILAGNLNGQTQLFLAAKWIDGKEYFFEFDKFTMLSLLYKFEDIEVGVFTAFDKKADLLEIALFESHPPNIMFLKYDATEHRKIDSDETEGLFTTAAIDTTKGEKAND
jgi:hypothetical protein